MRHRNTMRQDPRAGGQRLDGAGEHEPPRGRRGRWKIGGRGRHPGPDSPRIHPPPRDSRTGKGTLRHRAHVLAQGRVQAQADPGIRACGGRTRRLHPEPYPGSPRQFRLPGQGGGERGALYGTDLRDQRRVHRGRGFRTQALPHPEAHRAAGGGWLYLLPVQPEYRVQGHAHEPPAPRVFHGPDEPVVHQRDGDRPFPLLDEHVPAVEPGAAFPDALPQWETSAISRRSSSPT